MLGYGGTIEYVERLIMGFNRLASSTVVIINDLGADIQGVKGLTPIMRNDISYMSTCELQSHMRNQLWDVLPTSKILSPPAAGFWRARTCARAQSLTSTQACDVSSRSWGLGVGSKTRSWKNLAVQLNADGSFQSCRNGYIGMLSGSNHGEKGRICLTPMVCR